MKSFNLLDAFHGLPLYIHVLNKSLEIFFLFSSVCVNECDKQFRIMWLEAYSYELSVLIQKLEAMLLFISKHKIAYTQDLPTFCIDC